MPEDAPVINTIFWSSFMDVAQCRRMTHNWPLMIVLKDGSLPRVWAEYHSLRKLQTGQEHQQNWGERHQHFRWVNHIR